MADQATTLWKLERDGKAVSCLARLVPYGIEIDIAHDDVVVLTRSFETDREALTWADTKRAAREAEGWLAVAMREDRRREIVQ